MHYVLLLPCDLCFNNCDLVFLSSVFDFHQAADGIQEQQRQEQAGKKYVFLFLVQVKQADPDPYV